MFNSLNIGVKLVISMAITIILGLIAFVAVVSVQVSQTMQSEAEKLMLQASKRYANKIEGALNENIALIKANTRVITDSIKINGFFDIKDAKSNIDSIFESSSYASYAFVILNNNEFLNPENTIKKEYKDERGSFGMLFHDADLTKVGGLETLQFSEKIKDSPVVKRINSSVSGKDLDTIYIGIPAKLNFGKGEFIGINIAMPIFSPKGDYIGIVGYTFDFMDFADALLDKRLDLFEGDYRVLLAGDGTVSVHSNPDMLLKNITEINKRSPESSAKVLEAVRRITTPC